MSSGLLILNKWIFRQLEVVSPSASQKAAVVSDVFPEEKETIKGTVTRKTRLDPNRDFSQSIVYLDGKEMARFKSREGDIYDLTGSIPNGEVSFANESKGTYGVENYYDNKLHGSYKEYYRNGNLREERQYFNGKARWLKEYYIDGQIRMEIDYEDALTLSDDSEAGRGKVYYRDGTLRYEWRLTNTEKNRYKKAYNIKGELTEAKYYDQYGNLLKIVRPSR